MTCHPSPKPESKVNVGLREPPRCPLYDQSMHPGSREGSQWLAAQDGEDYRHLKGRKEVCLYRTQRRLGTRGICGPPLPETTHRRRLRGLFPGGQCKSGENRRDDRRHTRAHTCPHMFHTETNCTDPEPRGECVLGLRAICKSGSSCKNRTYFVYCPGRETSRIPRSHL